MGQNDRPEEEPKGELAVKTRRPVRFLVVIHNDAYTTMDFVIDVLKRFFKKEHGEAVELMLTVHQAGAAPAGVYSRDIAETLIAEVRAFAVEQRQPLQLTMEPE